MNNIKIFITGGTGDLGSALTKTLLSHKDICVVTNGRDRAKADTLIASLPEEAKDRFVFIIADITNEHPDSISKRAYNVFNGIDIMISNVAVFAFDDTIEQNENEKKKLYETNEGSMRLADSVISYVTSRNEHIRLCDIGSTSVIADMIGTPFTDTYHYGKTKADTVRHSIHIAHANPYVTFRAFHPGSIDGKFAQMIAHRYGSTYVTSPDITARYAIDFFLKDSPEKILQEVFSSSDYFAWTKEGSWYDKEREISEHIEGLSIERIIKIPADGKNSFELRATS